MSSPTCELRDRPDVDHSSFSIARSTPLSGPLGSGCGLASTLLAARSRHGRVLGSGSRLGAEWPRPLRKAGGPCVRVRTALSSTAGIRGRDVHAGEEPVQAVGRATNASRGGSGRQGARVERGARWSRDGPATAGGAPGTPRRRRRGGRRARGARCRALAARSSRGARGCRAPFHGVHGPGRKRDGFATFPVPGRGRRRIGEQRARRLPGHGPRDGAPCFASWWVAVPRARATPASRMQLRFVPIP